jgi:hypothetical protein
MIEQIRCRFGSIKLRLSVEQCLCEQCLSRRLGLRFIYAFAGCKCTSRCPQSVKTAARRFSIHLCRPMPRDLQVLVYKVP